MIPFSNVRSNNSLANSQPQHNYLSTSGSSIPLESIPRSPGVNSLFTPWSSTTDKFPTLSRSSNTPHYCPSFPNNHPSQNHSYLNLCSHSNHLHNHQSPYSNCTVAGHSCPPNNQFSYQEGAKPSLPHPHYPTPTNMYYNGPSYTTTSSSLGYNLKRRYPSSDYSTSSSDDDYEESNSTTTSCTAASSPSCTSVGQFSRGAYSQSDNTLRNFKRLRLQSLSESDSNDSIQYVSGNSGNLYDGHTSSNVASSSRATPTNSERFNSAYNNSINNTSSLSILSMVASSNSQSFTNRNMHRESRIFDLSAFITSKRAYSISQPLSKTKMEKLLSTTYGGRVIVSRKRKHFLGSDASKAVKGRIDTTIIGIGVNENEESDNKSDDGLLNLDEQDRSSASPKKKVTQGRPFSSEMIVEVVFARNLDHLYGILCSKGITAESHRVKLKSDVGASSRRSSSTGIIKAESQQQSTLGKRSRQKKSSTPSLECGFDAETQLPCFSNSLNMVKNYFGQECSGFSIVTAYRQSSVDKSPFKLGTCPVVKFTITPVSDYSVQYLKKMAYPRYKANMKLYIIPTRTDRTYNFYTSASMFLQDQLVRLEHGYEFDTESKIFQNDRYQDLPNAVFDDGLSTGTESSSFEDADSSDSSTSTNKTGKVGLNFILN